MDEIDSLLDHFSNQERKLKRKQQTERKEAQREKQRRIKNTSIKQKLDDVFNDPFSETEIMDLTPFIRPTTKVDKTDLQLWINNFSEQDIRFIPHPESPIMNFIDCSIHCEEWLVSKLLEIGWIENKTDYKFESLCNSVSEILHETIVCFKMACKQMLRFLEFTPVRQEKTTQQK